MTFWHKKRPSDDDHSTIDNDGWLSLDDNGGTTPKSAKAILSGATAVILITLCVGVAWFLRVNKQPAPLEQFVSVSLPITAVPGTAITSAAATAVSPTAAPISTPIPTSLASEQLPESSPASYDPNALAALMLDMVNAEREANGLSAVAWDATAALAGRLHAEEMAEFHYFSHWNIDGFGPDHRYSQMGGQHAVMENLHAFSYIYDDGRAAPIENWPEIIQNAHIGLMNSPGHRANILDPAHTHVGIGMAYNAETGQFRLAQEFTNQYGRLFPRLPLLAAPDDTIIMRGHLTGDNLSNLLLNLAYEPLPTPLSQETLNRTSTYRSAAESVTTRQIGLAFDENVALDNNAQAGLYHIRLFVDVAGEQALVVDHVITVR